MSNKSICIMGQGRSHVRVKEFADSFEEILLCNMGNEFIEILKKDPEIIDILRDKKCTLFCNASKSGFTKLAFETFNVERCIVNRVKPSPGWKLWKQHKSLQEKGIWYHNDKIPAFEKDLPYFYKWRGPAPYNPDGTPNPKLNVNYPEMKISNGFTIDHLSEKVEMYLFEPTRDRLETNMGLYYTALYSILDLEKTNLLYCGLDFYDMIGDGPSWGKSHSDKRIQMEGAHMKILLNDYLARYFPHVLFEFYTYANFDSDKENVKIYRGESE